MDFAFDEAERQLRDSVNGYLARHAPLSHRTQTSRGEPGFDQALWRGLADDLGVLGLLVPEEHGGLNASLTDLLVVTEEIGAALLLEPFVETAIAGSGLLRTLGERALSIFEGIATGERRIAIAFGEEFHGDGQVRAEPSEGGWIVDGNCIAVTAAPWATDLLVVARHRDGIGVFLIDPAAAGVNLISYPTIDGRRASDLALTGVQVSSDALLSGGSDASDAIARARDLYLAALGAEAIGIMRRMLMDTRDYCLERRQFGQPIARFQVIQHRLVDMYLQFELATSAVYRAVLAIDGDENERSRAVGAMRVCAGEALRFVAQNAVQLHGGMGMSDEMAVSHYFRRATALGVEFGSPEEAIRDFANLPTPA